MHTDLDEQSRELVDRLRQLPDEMVPPCNWQEFQRRSQDRLQERRPAARQWMDWAFAGTAAALVIFVGGAAMWSGGGESASAPASATRLPPAASVNAAGDGSAEVGVLTGDIAARATQADAARSVAIERWLASLPQEPAVVHVGTRAAVAGLEDQIAQVDDMLTSARMERKQPDRFAVLQQERARLVGSLAQVRYAEVVAAASP